ncbi:mitochondrial carrier [Syncephalis pseudoplumigaleata]|uniref:Mitochondrial carrier n=1 Tax=Syncephalis pseudoplumigaleata TaxID=1712513 RepID=A0A4P9YWM9_9FUNG|nr:mitochondrial carrier [Syncephalis pseudoplumigaleata]|eukprot:RKP23350.1 mitochondrial carrier [Syncephalis pseudoplumigaleata]
MAAAEEHDYEALPETTPLYTHLLAGALAGISEHSIMYPFDFIKTRMQIINPNPQAVYHGITHAIQSIRTTEGAQAMWRGISSMVVGAGPAHALYFATYEHCKEMFGGNIGDEHHFLATGAAGACATVTSDALMNPFDVVKQRMQVHGSTFRSVLACTAHVLRTEGIAAFYVSYPTTLVMNVPFQSVQFPTYEYFRKVLNPSGAYDPVTHIISGGLAGSIAAAVTTPLDVAKTLLQTRGYATDADIRNASGLRAAFRIIYQRNGVAGFFRGMQPRVLAHMPSTAICWTTYEYFKWIIGAQEAERISELESDIRTTARTTADL